MPLVEQGLSVGKCANEIESTTGGFIVSDVMSDMWEHCLFWAHLKLLKWSAVMNYCAKLSFIGGIISCL